MIHPGEMNLKDYVEEKQ